MSDFVAISDNISRNALLEELEHIAEIHPYKVVGDRDSYSPYNEGWSDCISLIEHYLEQLPSAKPERKWIPVTERLPETGKTVLVTVEGWNSERYVYSDCRYKNGIWESCEEPIYDYWTELTGVIAWMPFPEPANRR